VAWNTGVVPKVLGVIETAARIQQLAGLRVLLNKPHDVAAQPRVKRVDVLLSRALRRRVRRDILLDGFSGSSALSLSIATTPQR